MPRSPEDFAKEKHERKGSACRTCQNPEWKEAIHRALKGWTLPTSGTPSLAAMLAWLEKEYDYDLTEHALRNHVKNHESATWQKVVKRHGLKTSSR